MIPYVISANSSVKECYNGGNRLGSLDNCTSCVVKQNLSREYSLELECPLTKDNFDLLKCENIIMAKVQKWGGITVGYDQMPEEDVETSYGYPQYEGLTFSHDPTIQPFRIRSVEFDISNQIIKITAKHIYKDSEFILVNPITIPTSGDGVYPYYVFHNIMGKTSWSASGIFYITFQHYYEPNHTYLTSTGVIKSLSEILDTVFPSSSYGLYVDANMILYYPIYKSKTEPVFTSEIEMQYGRNLLEYNRELDSSEAYTHVKAYYKRDSNYCESSMIKLNYESDFKKVLMLDVTSGMGNYASVPALSQIDYYLNSYLAWNPSLGTTKISDSGMSSNVFELYNGTYAIDPFIGAAINVDIPHLQIDTQSMIYGFTYDSLLERVTELELGNDHSDIIDTIKSI